MIGIAYAEGWQDYTPSYCFKPVDGVTTLVLSAECSKDFVNGDMVAVLPEGFRPPTMLQMPAIVLSGTASVTIAIHPSGKLLIYENGAQRGTVGIVSANITFLTK